jgi:hypothetical protein
MTGGLRILLLAMGGLGVVWLIVSTGAPDKAPANEEWRVIGGFPDGEKTKFVEISLRMPKIVRCMTMR